MKTEVADKLSVEALIFMHSDLAGAVQDIDEQNIDEAFEQQDVEKVAAFKSFEHKIPRELLISEINRLEHWIETKGNRGS